MKFLIGDVLERTIAMIEMGHSDTGEVQKQLHFMAYSWAPEKERCVFCEYTGFIVPLQLALEYGIADYESDYQEEITQYCEDCSEETVVSYYQRYNNGSPAVPIKIKEITADTPCGCYLLIGDE